LRIEDAYQNASDDAYEHTKVKGAKEGVAWSCRRRQKRVLPLPIMTCASVRSTNARVEGDGL
jgi:hypothetical protein